MVLVLVVDSESAGVSATDGVVRAGDSALVFLCYWHAQLPG